MAAVAAAMNLSKSDWWLLPPATPSAARQANCDEQPEPTRKRPQSRKRTRRRRRSKSAISADSSGQLAAADHISILEFEKVGESPPPMSRSHRRRRHRPSTSSSNQISCLKRSQSAGPRTDRLPSLGLINLVAVVVCLLLSQIDALDQRQAAAAGADSIFGQLEADLRPKSISRQRTPTADTTKPLEWPPAALAEQSGQTPRANSPRLTEREQAGQPVELTFVREENGKIELENKRAKRSIAVRSTSSAQPAPPQTRTIGIANEQQPNKQSKQAAADPTTRLVALSGHSIELQCPLASELLAVANSGATRPDHTIVWRKDGIQLNQLTNPRLRLNPINGSLVIARAQAKLDEGNFECNLVNVANEDLPIKWHRFQLKLLLAPRLNPFEFPADAQVGMKMLLTCSALEGQQPISFVWLKDNQIIQDVSSMQLHLEPPGQSQSAGQSSSDNNKDAADADKAKFNASSTRLRAMLSSSLEQLHQQQLADKLAVSSQESDPTVVSGQKPEYVLIDGVRSAAGPAGWFLQDAADQAAAKGDPSEEPLAPISTSLTTILADPSIRIRQSNDYSILSIEQLELKHSGRYTCTAQNEAARASHSSQLTINAPPSLKVEPKDADLVSGQSTVIECAAVGQPRPTISWLRARESSSKQWDFVQIYDSLRYSILANGSLAISNATQREQGLYMCSAKNGFGPEVTKLIKITIHEPARIATKYKTSETRIDERALMSCLVSGEQPVSLHWLDKQGKLIDKNDKRFIIDDGDPSAVLQDQAASGADSGSTGAPQPTNANQTESRLIIARASRQDSGHYTCQASNRYGGDKMVTNLLVLDVPDKVAQLKVTNVTANTVSLRWQLPFNGNSPVTSYLVQYQSDDPLDDLLMSLNNDNQAISGSTGGQQRLMEGGSGGLLDQSISSLFGSSGGEPAEKRGLDLHNPGQPTSLSSLKAALETLNKIATESTKTSNADEAIDRTLVELTIEQTATNVVIKDLSPFCVYRLRLAGINKIGLGEFSDWLRFKTEEAPPSGTALKISASATGPNSIKLTWFPPDRRHWNGQLTRFNIGYRPLDSAFEFNKSIEWAPQSIQSMILDKVGDKTIAAPANQRTPGPERSLGPTHSGSTSPERQQQQQQPTGANNTTTAIDSTKTSAKTNNENSSSSFMLRQHLRQLLALQQQELLAHLTNLQRSTTYLVWIQAVNGRGVGPQSHAITVKTLDDVPPSAPALRIQTTTTNSITLTWSMLSNFVSSANQYSLFYRRVPPQLPSPTVATSTPLLTNSRRQQLAPSNGSSSSAIDLPPLASLINGGQLMLNAAAAAESGPFIERTITSQQLMANGVGIEAVQQQDFLALQEAGKLSPGGQYQHHYQQFVYTLDQLDCGSVYELYMTTRNSVGKSEPSAVITTRTLGEPPLAPSNKNSLFTRIGAQDVQLNLASWSTGGCPVTHITVRYKQTPTPTAASSTSSGHADDNPTQSRNNSVVPQLHQQQQPPTSSGWPISTSVPANLLANINSQLDPANNQHHRLQQQFHPFALTSPANLIEQQQQQHFSHQNVAPFVLKNLQPNTGYELEIIAHNVAGLTTGQYEFVTAGLNGSQSGYTRREGVYRIGQRLQQLDSGGGDNNQQQFGEQHQALDHSSQSISNQLFPLALTILCFVCVIISSTFCYYRLAETWKRNHHQRRHSTGDESTGGGPPLAGNRLHTGCPGSSTASPGSTILAQMAKSAGLDWSAGSRMHMNGTATLGQQQRQHLRFNRHEQLDDGQSIDSPPLSTANEDGQLGHYCLRDHHHNNNNNHQPQQFPSATLNPKCSQSVSMKDFNLIGPNGLHALTLNLKNCRQPAANRSSAGAGLMLMKGVNLQRGDRTSGAVELVGDGSRVQQQADAYGNRQSIYDHHQICQQQQQLNNNYSSTAANGCKNHPAAYGAANPDEHRQHETSYMTTVAASANSNGLASHQPNGATLYAIPTTATTFYQQQQQQHTYDPPNMNYQPDFNPTADQQLQTTSIDDCIEHLMHSQHDQNSGQQQYPMIVNQQQQQQTATNNNQCASYANSDNLDSWHQVNLNQYNNNNNNISVGQQQTIHCSGQSVIESSSSSSGIGTSAAANSNLDCGASSIISSNATNDTTNNHSFNLTNNQTLSNRSSCYEPQQQQLADASSLSSNNNNNNNRNQFGSMHHPQQQQQSINLKQV